MALQHIEISAVRQSSAIPVVVVVLGVIHHTTPAVEDGQLRRFVVTAQRLIGLVFEDFVASAFAATRRPATAAIIQSDNELIIVAIAIGSKHIRDFQFDGLHLDGLIIRGVAALRIVNLQFGGVAALLDVSEAWF